MKKMLTVNTLALSSIKTRKKQYILMIVGIIFAMIFSSSILFFASSIKSSSEEMSRISVGDCDAILTNCDKEFIENAVNDKMILDYSYAHIIGFAKSEGNKEDQGAAIGYLDDKAKELSYISFIEGGYPENEGEIALEKSTLARLKMTDAKIGDTITLDFYNQNGTELEEKPVQKTYKIVGIADNKLTNIIAYRGDAQKYFKAIPSAFVYQGANTDIGGKENLCTYVNFNDKFTYKDERDSYSSRYEYMSDKGFFDNTGCEAVDLYSDFYDFLDGGTYTTIILVVVLVVVLLIASAMGIINAFNSNLKDRKKQIGLFRTVGATRQQIIHIYGREAFIISLVCTPVSVALSYLLVKVATKLLGENFIFMPNILVLILSGFVSVIFVMLAAVVPLLSASRISPIQSIRDIELTRKMKNKKIKSKKSFNTPSLLAKRSLVFHRGKRIIVSILLIGTIIISCFGFSFLNYSMDDYYQHPYDYSLDVSHGGYVSSLCNVKTQEGFNENQRRDILLSPYVDKVTGSKVCNAIVMKDQLSEYDKLVCQYYSWDVFNSSYWDEDGHASITVTKDNYDEVFMSEFSDNYLDIKQHYSISQDFYPIELKAADSTILEQLNNNVIDGKINIDKINSGQEVILFAPQKIGLEFELDEYGYSSGLDTDDNFDSKKDYMKTAECDYKAGDTIDISVITGQWLENSDYESFNYQDKNDSKVKIGAVISELPRGAADALGFYCDFNLITSISGFEKFYPDSRYDSFNIYLKTECNDDIEKEMTTLLENVSAATTANPYIYSMYGNQKDNEQTRNTLFISLIAIIILFLSISASIINNSFSAQIREGKREIGTLRAVGASQREIVMSYIKQLISIFGWGYGIGFAGFGIIYGISYFVSYMNAKEFGYDFTGLDLKVTLWQTILACAILFAVCSINLMVKIKKEMKNSIIENIREL